MGPFFTIQIIPPGLLLFDCPKRDQWDHFSLAKNTLQRFSFSGRFNTAFIERVNLTVRHGVAALARRTWATAQQSPHLLAHLEWWRAYYHFVRPHASLRVALAQPRERGGKRLARLYQQQTKALAADRTTRRWTVREVLSCPLPKLSA